MKIIARIHTDFPTKFGVPRQSGLAGALEGRISKESPVGRAVLGHRVGDRVEVETDSGYRYFIQIRKIEKGTDDASLPISSY